MSGPTAHRDARGVRQAQVPYEVVKHEDLVKRWPQVGDREPASSSASTRRRGRAEGARRLCGGGAGVREERRHVRPRESAVGARAGEAPDGDAVNRRDRQRRNLRLRRWSVAADDVSRRPGEQVDGGQARLLHGRAPAGDIPLRLSESAEYRRGRAERRRLGLAILMGSATSRSIPTARPGADRRGPDRRQADPDDALPRSQGSADSQRPHLPERQHRRRELHHRPPSRAGECVAGRWRLLPRVQDGPGGRGLHRRPHCRTRPASRAGVDLSRSRRRRSRRTGPLHRSTTCRSSQPRQAG